LTLYYDNRQLATLSEDLDKTLLARTERRERQSPVTIDRDEIQTAGPRLRMSLLSVERSQSPTLLDSKGPGLRKSTSSAMTYWIDSIQPGAQVTKKEAKSLATHHIGHNDNPHRRESDFPVGSTRFRKNASVEGATVSKID
jgi:hypothetical protein